MCLSRAWRRRLLRPGGLGEGVAGRAEYRDEHLRLTDLAAVALDNRHRLAGIVDEQLLADAVLLARDRDQCDRLVLLVHPVAPRARADLGIRRAASAFRRHGGDRHDASGNQRQCTRHTARGRGAASTRRSGDSPLGMPSQRYRLADCGPARARRHGGHAADGWIGWHGRHGEE